jgi:streptogramin lyase
VLGRVSVGIGRWLSVSVCSLVAVEVWAALAGAQPAAAAIGPSLLVANNAANTLTPYPLSTRGNASPSATVFADGAGSLNMPEAVAVDGSGDVWTTNLDTIVEYSQSQLDTTGPPTPIQTITSDGSGSLADPTGVAFDPEGDLWVSNIASNTVVEFTKSQLGAGGAQTPAVTLSSDAAETVVLIEVLRDHTSNARK